MSQPSPKAPAGLQYDQTTTHPHRLSPVSYGVAHTKTGCTLHPSDAQAIRPPTLWSSAPAASETGEGGRPVQQLVAQESDSFNKGSKWIGGFFDRAQPSFTAQPELSRAFTRWQEYISHHIEALSHSPPQFTVQLTSTLHDVEEKCDMSGVCLAIILPLRVMGMDEQHCMAYGMLPRHDVVVCVEVGRQLSSSQTAIAFHYSVQVFSVAGQRTQHIHSQASTLACPISLNANPLFCPHCVRCCGQQCAARGGSIILSTCLPTASKGGRIARRLPTVLPRPKPPASPTEQLPIVHPVAGYRTRVRLNR